MKKTAILFVLLLFLPAALASCKPDNIDVSQPAASFTPVSIEIMPAAAGMAPDSSLQLKAVGTFSNNQKRDVTSDVSWNSSDPAVAAVDATGLVSSRLVTSGTATITATSGTTVGSLLLTLSPAVSVRIVPAASGIAGGSVRQLSAIAVLQNGAEQDITNASAWSSSDPVIAMIGTGLASAAPGSTGSSVISATFSALTGTALLSASDVQAMSLSPFNPIVTAGATRQFSATAMLGNDLTQDLTSFATWSSSKPEIAIVSSSGLAASVAPGSAVITASFGGVSGSALLTVQEASPSPVVVPSPSASPSSTSQPTTTTVIAPLIVIAPSAPSLVLGNTVQLHFLVLSSNGIVLQDLTASAVWTSSNSTIAFVSQGLATGLAAGTTTITATSGTLSAGTVLTITPF